MANAKMPAHKRMAMSGKSPYAKGGKVHADAAQDRKLIRQEIAKAERAEKPALRKGGKVC